jgi:tRNA(Ile)-lysidine synthetase-like protein
VEEIFGRQGGALIAPLDAVRSMAVPLRRRALRWALSRYAEKMVDSAKMDAVMGLTGGARPAGRVRLAGVEAWVSMGRLRIGRPVERVAIRPVEIRACGVYPMDWRGTNLRIGRLDAETATLRGWQPGDRAGWGHVGRSLKEEFQRARIPAWERAGWPVLEAGGRVVWAGTLGSAGEVEASELAAAPEWGPGSPI